MVDIAAGWRPARDSVKLNEQSITEVEVYSSSASSSNGDSVSRIENPGQFYSDAYSHGYTEGYIAGYDHPPIPKPPPQIPIAIIGMSCRLPGNVTSPDEFWEMCSRARNVWSAVPKERFDAGAFYHPNPGKKGCFNATGGYFLKEDVGLFDAPFFSLTAQEATSMDPQQRILLECTFEALDSAGIPKQDIIGKSVGVFIGGSFSEYEAQLFSDTDSIPMHQSTGCAFAMQSNRISHFFDLRGPSFTMDTACSSSLVAIHQACQSLKNAECTTAIVGGCHLNMLPEFWISMSQSRLFSDAGRSFSFDNRGTGYGRGEGCGMVVLKPLDQALKDNDNIRSIIVASGINQDGRTPGITMPNGSAQESLMKSVYVSAGLDPKDTGYIEAHGTGTKVGDPIEAKALHQVFGEGRNSRNPLFVGSVKSNIGHLEAASGIMAIIKTSMMLERGFILPNFDYQKPNENIPFSEWNLKVPISQRPWPRSKKYASVNNFGFGGTNSHVVLQRAPLEIEHQLQQPEPTFQSRKLFVLSANDKCALDQLMNKMGIYLEQRPEIFQNDLMSNVAYTLGERRSLMQWRFAVATTSSFDLIQSLNSGKISPQRETEPLRIGFIFTGQGAQWAGMGCELYEQYPIFSSSIDACDAHLRSFGAKFSLLAELQKDTSISVINEAHISQPTCTAVQIALVKLLRSWGVFPTAVTGHSSGEIAAAFAAGILSAEACMAIAYYRGLATVQLKKEFPDIRGAMIAVGASKEDIEPILSSLTAGEASIACYNSPSSLTISGDASAIEELASILEAKGIFNRKLQVDMAYHSHHMGLVAKFYGDALRSLVLPQSTDVKFHSSLVGHLLEGSLLGSSYWVDNLTNSVRFSEALSTMCDPTESFKTGVNIFIELGPHSALGGPIKQILKACGSNAMKIPYTSALVRGKDAVETALDLASTLFMKGAALNLGAVNIPRGKKPTLLVDMPRYPWNHQTRYWHESRLKQKHKSRPEPRNDLLGVLATYSNELEPTWRNVLRIDDLPWLRHHKIQGLILFPMSGFISMAIEAGAQRARSNSIQFERFELKEVSIVAPLIVTDDDLEITLQLRPYQEATFVSSDTWDEFRIHSWATNKGWTEHCRGLIALRTEVCNISMKSQIDSISRAATNVVDTSHMYSSLSEIGVEYGPSFQGINACKSCNTSSTANISVVDIPSEMPQGFQTGMVAHPTVLEQLIEMYWPAMGAGREPLTTIFLPSSIGSLTISQSVTGITQKPGSTMRAFCQGPCPSASLHSKPIKMSMFASTSDDNTEAVMILNDLVVAPILNRDIDTDSEVPRELCYKLDWESAETLPTFSEFPNTEISIIHTDSESQNFLACDLANALELATGKRPIVGGWSQVDPSGTLCLFLSELDKPHLCSLSPTDFTSLQKMITRVHGILWVVRGAYENSKHPNVNMVTGFSRSIRSEALLKFATLDLDSETPLGDTDLSKVILDVFNIVFGSAAGSNCELEFAEREGHLLTPRIVNDVVMNEYVHAQITTSSLESAPFVQDGRPLKMVIRTPGSLDSLHFVNQTAYNDLMDDEVLINVKAIGMNTGDLQIALGHLDAVSGTDFGVECSGIVIKTGKGATGISLGDRVACISVSQGGVYSTFARAKMMCTFPIQNTVSFEEAASLPVAWSTACYGLVNIGRILQNEKILIHGAVSAVGTAALRLAQTTGATIFATVPSHQDKENLMKEFELGDDRIFTNNSCLRHAITKQRFDVVISCVPTSANYSQDLWASLNSFGRFIEVARGDIPTRFECTVSDSNKSFASVDILSLATQRPKLMSQLMDQVGALLKQGKLHPFSNITIFPISDVGMAFKTLQSGELKGKLIVAPERGDLVKATISKKACHLLHSDGTYLLIGGTGGLGRSMARWMVEKGARNIVLISRTGTETGKVKDLIDYSSTVGANVVVRQCDVAKKEDMEDLIQNHLVGMPAIRGIVHGAMVLHDVLFEEMTFEQYNTVISSKVHGAWNLHNALASTALDFFITISSAAGAVGNRGQAAYSAANTFLNAFVQYRLSLSLPASSIDLTAVSDAGYLAENSEAAVEVSKNLGSETICEAEVLALLGAAISGKMSETCNNHTITGMRITNPPPFWTHDAKFKYLRLAAEETLTSSSSNTTAVSFNAALKASTSIKEAHGVVCRGLLSKLPSVLMLEAEDMDVTRSLANYALDSLVAIEVRNYITREFEANLQVLELLSSGSIESLAKTICGKSKLVSFAETSE